MFTYEHHALINRYFEYFLLRNNITIKPIKLINVHYKINVYLMVMNINDSKCFLLSIIAITYIVDIPLRAIAHVCLRPACAINVVEYSIQPLAQINR